jgi:hypothetical protein
MEKYTIITAMVHGYDVQEFHKVETDNLPDLLRTDERFNKHNIAYVLSGWVHPITYHPKLQKVMYDKIMG